MSEKPTSRRTFLKAGAGIVVVAAVGGAAYYYLTQAPAPPPAQTTTAAATTAPAVTTTAAATSIVPPTSMEYLAKFPNWQYYYSAETRPTLKYLGGAWMMYPEVQEFWSAVHKQPVEASYLDLFVMAQRIVATEGYGWDVAGTARFPPIKKAGLILPIPVDKLPAWNETKVVDMFIHPERYLKAAQVPRFNYDLWFSEDDYTSHKNLALVSNNWNFDSVTYLPEKLPFEEKGGQKTSISYSELWNKEWKGRAMMQDEAATVFSESANELDATGQVKVSGAIDSLTRDEVDKVFNYLLPIIKSGQVRTFWFKYGDAVTTISTREIWIASTWQPICYDTRRAGTPAYYARLANGPFFWFNGDIISKQTQILDDVYKFINFRIDTWWDAFITRNGYGTMTSNYPEVRDYEGAEFFDWVNNGTATYLPIDRAIKEYCFTDRPELWTLDERLLNALFLPDKYFPPGEKPRVGSADPHGNLRDLGSIADKQKITRYFLSPDLPDDLDYYTEKYTDLKAQIPS